MVINTNIEAQATANNLNASQLQLAKSLSRLSSGSKIIVPSDDAAGLAVSSRLNSQIKRLDSALNNVVNAVSFTQTQDGFMKTIDKAFRRMGELAMLAQDTTKSDEDRALYNQEFSQLKSYVSETTKQDFNGVSLFAGKTLDVTVDADGTTFSMVGINLEDPTYTSATNTGNDAWKLTSDAYMLSKDGYKAETTTYKTSHDLWRTTQGAWATSDNGGIKITSGSYVTEVGAATADTGETSIAVDNFLAAAVVSAGWSNDYVGNKLTKTSHGMESGDALTFHSNAPGGTIAATTYYVNKVDANNITLHTSKAHATAGTSKVELNRSGATTAVTGIAAANTNDVLTKASHGFTAGDAVSFTGTAPAGATIDTTYYVGSGTGSATVPAGTFKLYTTATAALTGHATTGVVAITADSTGHSIESNMVGGGNVINATDRVTKTAHGLTTGAKIRVTTAAGTPTGGAGTAGYVRTIDANTFEIYNTAANAKAAVGTTGIIAFGANATGTMRYSVEASSEKVAIYDKGNELKKGMFTTLSPITTGEDKDAVLAKSGEVVNIAKTTQDISAFANELGENYDDVNLRSVESAQTALILVKTAITQVATDRAKLGAVQSRLNFTNEQLTVTKENLSAAISRIADVDVAEEATNYARYQILVASGTEMLKQANQLPQSALQLLR